MSSGPFINRVLGEKQSEVFRLYLEEKGVMDVMTTIFADLNGMTMSERPSDPLMYIAERLLPSRPGLLKEKYQENCNNDKRTQILQMGEQIRLMKDLVDQKNKDVDNLKRRIEVLEKELNKK